MAIEPVKIPQDLQIEDRIIGPITLRQIMITMVGGGFSYMIWTILQQSMGPNLVSTALSLIPVIIVAAFAFVKINSISLFRILLLQIERSQKPPIRKWSPREGIQINIRTYSKKEEKPKPKKEKKREGIAELTQLLDRGPPELQGAQQIPAKTMPALPSTEPIAKSLAGEIPKEMPEAEAPPVDPKRVATDPLKREEEDADAADLLGGFVSPQESASVVRDIHPPS